MTNCWKATSNAVERANRCFRAQNSIYSVRTKEHLEQRLALDMHREQRAPKRRQTVKMPAWGPAPSPIHCTNFAKVSEKQEKLASQATGLGSAGIRPNRLLSAG